MENKKEVMEAIMMGNSNNMRMIEDLLCELDVNEMLNHYHMEISNRNYHIERAGAFWNDISEERIKSENAKVVEDSEKIAEIKRILEYLKRLIEEEYKYK